MPNGYHHLTQDLRCQLYFLMKSKKTQAEIAKELNVHPSTISRELAKNTGDNGYHYQQAHEMTQMRRRNASGVRRKMTNEMIARIDEKLQLQWSPEQIAGRFKKEGYPISHETIYAYVWADKSNGGQLYRNLRHNGKKYNKRSKTTAGRGSIPNRIDISERPNIVEEKQRLGDWETDTIISKGQQEAIVSLVERSSKLTKLIKIRRKTSEQVEEAIIHALTPYKNYVHTITSDNGKEFACHTNISKELNAAFYFATPYHSWERGLNEHTNGLVRQYLPKEMYFEEITQEQVDAIEMLLNNRPRKVLEFLTPLEMFEIKRRTMNP